MLFWWDTLCQYTPLLNLVLLPFGCLCSIILTITYSIISYGNTIFDLCPYDLQPLFFQEHNYGIKKGLVIFLSVSHMYNTHTK
jgi:hypothetical protein